MIHFLLNASIKNILYPLEMNHLSCIVRVLPE